VGSERHVCNVTEGIITVQGQFRVIQGRSFWYPSKARMRFPISDQWQLWSYLAPLRRYCRGGRLFAAPRSALLWGHPVRAYGPAPDWPDTSVDLVLLVPRPIGRRWTGDAWTGRLAGPCLIRSSSDSDPVPAPTSEPAPVQPIGRQPNRRESPAGSNTCAQWFSYRYRIFEL